MKEKSRFIGVGITIYIALSGIDRFVYPIPNVIYIPFAILGIALILIGFLRGNRNNKISAIQPTDSILQADEGYDKQQI